MNSIIEKIKTFYFGTKKIYNTTAAVKVRNHNKFFILAFSTFTLIYYNDNSKGEIEKFSSRHLSSICFLLILSQATHIKGPEDN